MTEFYLLIHCIIYPNSPVSTLEHLVAANINFLFIWKEQTQSTRTWIHWTSTWTTVMNLPITQRNNSKLHAFTIMAILNKNMWLTADVTYPYCILWLCRMTVFSQDIWTGAREIVVHPIKGLKMILTPWATNAIPVLTMIGNWWKQYKNLPISIHKMCSAVQWLDHGTHYYYMI